MIRDGCGKRRPASLARPSSLDLRERVVSAVWPGETCRSVAARFDVAVSTVVKWLQRHRAPGSVAPGQMGGHRRRVLEPNRDLIFGLVARPPHLTVRGLRDIFLAHGITVSRHAVCQFFRREGLSFKKERRSLLSRARPMWPAGGGAGRYGRRAWIPNAWCSLARPGSRPTWRRSGAGDRRVNVCARLCAARPVAHRDVPGGAPLRPANGAVRLRRPH